MKTIIVFLIAVVCLSTKSYGDLYYSSDTTSRISKSLVKKRHYKRHYKKHIDGENFTPAQLGFKSFDDNPDYRASVAKQQRDAGPEYIPVNNRDAVSGVRTRVPEDELQAAEKDGMILAPSDTPEQIRFRIHQYSQARLYKRIGYSSPIIFIIIGYLVYLKKRPKIKQLL